MSIYFMMIFWRANALARALDFKFEKFDKFRYILHFEPLKLLKNWWK